jgi:hypothetical protein
MSYTTEDYFAYDVIFPFTESLSIFLEKVKDLPSHVLYGGFLRDCLRFYFVEKELQKIQENPDNKVLAAFFEKHKCYINREQLEKVFEKNGLTVDNFPEQKQLLQKIFENDKYPFNDFDMSLTRNNLNMLISSLCGVEGATLKKGYHAYPTSSTYPTEANQQKLKFELGGKTILIDCNTKLTEELASEVAEKISSKIPGSIKCENKECLGDYDADVNNLYGIITDSHSIMENGKKIKIYFLVWSRSSKIKLCDIIWCIDNGFFIPTDKFGSASQDHENYSIRNPPLGVPREIVPGNDWCWSHQQNQNNEKMSCNCIPYHKFFKNGQPDKTGPKRSHRMENLSERGWKKNTRFCVNGNCIMASKERREQTINEIKSLLEIYKQLCHYHTNSLPLDDNFNRLLEIFLNEKICYDYFDNNYFSKREDPFSIPDLDVTPNKINWIDINAEDNVNPEASALKSRVIANYKKIASRPINNNSALLTQKQNNLISKGDLDIYDKCLIYWVFNQGAASLHNQGQYVSPIPPITPDYNFEDQYQQCGSTYEQPISSPTFCYHQESVPLPTIADDIPFVIKNKNSQKQKKKNRLQELLSPSSDLVKKPEPVSTVVTVSFNITSNDINPNINSNSDSNSNSNSNPKLSRVDVLRRARLARMNK